MSYPWAAAKTRPAFVCLCLVLSCLCPCECVWPFLYLHLFLSLSLLHSFALLYFALLLGKILCLTPFLCARHDDDKFSTCNLTLSWDFPNSSSSQPSSPFHSLPRPFAPLRYCRTHAKRLQDSCSTTVERIRPAHECECVCVCVTL